MVKEWKKKNVEELSGKFSKATGIILTEFRGLSVSDALTLRRSMWPLDAEYRVVKNSSLYYAAQGTALEGLNAHFTGPTAVLACFGDPMEPLKKLVKFMGEVPAVKMKAGMIDGRVLTSADLERLSALPSRQVLRAMAVGSIAAPLRGTVRAVAWPLQSLTNVLSQIAEQGKKAASA